MAQSVINWKPKSQQLKINKCQDNEWRNIEMGKIAQIKTYKYMQRAKVYKIFSNEYHYKNFKLISRFIPSNQSEKLNENCKRHRVLNTKLFIITRTVIKLSRVVLIHIPSDSILQLPIYYYLHRVKVGLSPSKKLFFASMKVL